MREGVDVAEGQTERDGVAGSDNVGADPTPAPPSHALRRKKSSRAMVRVYDHEQQERLVDDSIHDPRPAVATGFPGLDSLLRRGGLLAGNLVVLGGRTGTRKTTVMSNMVVNMVNEGVPVMLVGLDEGTSDYVTKLMSTWSGWPMEMVEEMWDDSVGRELRAAYRDWARGKVHVAYSRRPDPSHLSDMADMASLGGDAPKVVFVDYLAQMSRSGPYAYGDNSRLPLLAEDLGVWSTETGITTVVLHQLSRNDQFGGTNSRNSGHLPVTVEQLKFGGEEQADIVLGTYRPAMNPIASMTVQTAKEVLGDRFDEDDYHATRANARKYEASTFVQLLKNRPGTRRHEAGVEIVSTTDSLRMAEKELDDDE